MVKGKEKKQEKFTDMLKNRPLSPITYSQKTHNAKPGAMPHKHETRHYTSMSDASNLPQGYILLNGEPVRVADLEGK